MRIFQVCADPGIPPGGSRGGSVHLRGLAGALRDRGHEVIAFSPVPLRGAEQYPVPLKRLESLLGEAADSGLPDLIYERYALVAGGPDHRWRVSTAGLDGARELGCAYALEVNSPLIQEAQTHRGLVATPGLYEEEERIFREADAVFTVSTALRDYVSGKRGGGQGVVVNFNGCDPALFAKIGPRPPGSRKVVAFMGDPRPWHGAETLPGTIADLVTGGIDAHLLLIGGGPGADRVKQAAREAGTDDRLEITGSLPQREAVARLAEADAGLAPYLPDPFFYFCPIKLVEYMAAGLPVVSTDQGDLGTIVGGGGLLVKAGDRRAFSEAVSRILREPDLHRTTGRAARTRALTELSWDRSAAVVESCCAAAAL